MVFKTYMQTWCENLGTETSPSQYWEKKAGEFGRVCHTQAKCIWGGEHVFRAVSPRKPLEFEAHVWRDNGPNVFSKRWILNLAHLRRKGPRKEDHFSGLTLQETGAERSPNKS